METKQLRAYARAAEPVRILEISLQEDTASTPCCNPGSCDDNPADCISLNPDTSLKPGFSRLDGRMELLSDIQPEEGRQPRREETLTTCA